MPSCHTYQLLPEKQWLRFLTVKYYEQYFTTHMFENILYKKNKDFSEISEMALTILCHFVLYDAKQNSQH